MAYMIRITEWKTDGREFAIFCNELPATLAESISQAKPASLHDLANGFGHISGTLSESSSVPQRSSTQPS
jgi:hypothetical protein